MSTTVSATVSHATVTAYSVAYLARMPPPTFSATAPAISEPPNKALAATVVTTLSVTCPPVYHSEF